MPIDFFRRNIIISIVNLYPSCRCPIVLHTNNVYENIVKALRNYSIFLPKYKAESILFLLLRYMYIVYSMIRKYYYHISYHSNLNKKQNNQTMNEKPIYLQEDIPDLIILFETQRQNLEIFVWPFILESIRMQDGII